MHHVWQWFWDLSARRQVTEAGPQAISYTELRAWIELNRIPARADEISAITRMDNTYRHQSFEEMRLERQRQSAASAAPPSKKG